MSRMRAPTNFVGNDFILPQAKIKKIQPVVPRAPMPINIPVMATSSTSSIAVSVEHSTSNWKLPFEKASAFFHHYTMGVFAVLFLIVGSSGIQVASQYMSRSVDESIKKSASYTLSVPTISGLNKKVPTASVNSEVQKIITQSATLSVGDKQLSIKPETIKSWLKIAPVAGSDQSVIRVRANVIADSLSALANKQVISAQDQVTVTHEDGVPTVISQGKNGTRLTNPATLKTQSEQIAKTLMDSKGLAFNTPMETVPFQSVTPDAFEKLIEVNVSTKQLYAYEKGKMVKSYPISAGAPKTPTPIGQFKIFSKFAVQDMKGFNADGTKYFQPNVRWINYFLPGGFGIHGNYWRPTSWFGNINSSHGCVSLPNDQAKWIYDFAPVGTTVITHN